MAAQRIKHIRRDKLRFNILVVGESGLGKTTFLVTLLQKYCCDIQLTPRLHNPLQKTVEIGEIGRFQLTTTSGDDVEVVLYDSPGYGDFVNNQTSIDQVRSDLLRRHQLWLQLDLARLKRSDHFGSDERIHCAFYFIAPHRVKEIDLYFIRELMDIVPVVPVVAKADTMTLQEREQFLGFIADQMNVLSKEGGVPVVYNWNWIDGGQAPYETGGDHTTEGEGATSTSAPVAISLESLVSVGRTLAPRGGEVVSGEEKGVTEDGSGSSDESDHLSDNIFPSPATSGSASPSASAAFFLNPGNKSSPSSSPSGAPSTASTAPATEAAFAFPAERCPLPLCNIFAVISEQRVYPWGTAEVEDETHSDFSKLQRLLFESGYHIKALMDDTQGKTMTLTLPPPPRRVQTPSPTRGIPPPPSLSTSAPSLSTQSSPASLSSQTSLPSKSSAAILNTLKSFLKDPIHSAMLVPCVCILLLAAFHLAHAVFR